MLVLNLPFKALMFLTLMRPSLVLFLVLWLKLVKDFLKVRCRLALLPFLISCLIWLDLVASLPLIKERILVIILLLHFLSLMLGSVLVLRSEERFSRNAETDLVCRLLLEKKKKIFKIVYCRFNYSFFFLFCLILSFILFFFFLNDPASTLIYTLSLHDALPIFCRF